MNAEYNQKVSERKVLDENTNALKKKLAKLTVEVHDLEIAMIKAEDMKKFIEESFLMEKVRVDRPDYYMILEGKIEAKRQRFEIETVLEGIVSGVEDRYEEEKMKAISLCRSKQIEYVENLYVAPNLKEVITNEIYYAQESCIYYGENLGYSIVPQENVITQDRLQEVIGYIVQVIVQMLNEGLNADAVSRAWIMRDGRIIKVRFLYVLCYKYWKDVAIDREEMKACAAWEEIFVDPLECAKKAIVARVSSRMSKVAREQGKIWAKKHPKEIELARIALAEEYKSTYSSQPGSKVKIN